MMKIPKTVLTFAVTGFAAVNLHAAVSLPSVFSDHMVLQQGTPINIWGTAQPGQPVTVKLGAEQKEVKADAAGKWKVTFPQLKAGC